MPFPPWRDTRPISSVERRPPGFFRRRANLSTARRRYAERVASQADSRVACGAVDQSIARRMKPRMPVSAKTTVATASMPAATAVGMWGNSGTIAERKPSLT
jgi:hypothetical protein